MQVITALVQHHRLSLSHVLQWWGEWFLHATCILCLGLRWGALMVLHYDWGQVKEAVAAPVVLNQRKRQMGGEEQREGEQWKAKMINYSMFKMSWLSPLVSIHWVQCTLLRSRPLPSSKEQLLSLAFLHSNRWQSRLFSLVAMNDLAIRSI